MVPPILTDLGLASLAKLVLVLTRHRFSSEVTAAQAWVPALASELPADAQFYMSGRGRVCQERSQGCEILFRLWGGGLDPLESEEKLGAQRWEL